jgi:hypothetical protein
MGVLVMFPSNDVVHFGDPVVWVLLMHFFSSFENILQN